MRFILKPFVKMKDCFYLRESLKSELTLIFKVLDSAH